jgi:hypothetical protein
MTTVQIPPDGASATFDFDVPAPDGMDTLGGIRLYFTFAQKRPEGPFSVSLEIDGVQRDLVQTATGVSSLIYISQFHETTPAPLRATLTVNRWGHLDPGNTVTVYAWGAQTESGTGALNPDEGGESSSMTATINVGTVEVLSWLEWNRLTGANEGVLLDGS